MRAATFGAVLCLWLAGAAAASAAAAAGDEPAAVRINALRNPETLAYRAIAAGMDRFEALRALAPAVPALRFQLRNMDGGRLADETVRVALRADDWSIPVALDAERGFSPARSQAAWNARAELMLDRRERHASIAPDLRTPGLPENRRRMGDLRLSCQVQVAIGKEQLGFLWSAGLSALLRTSDWCASFDGRGKRQRGWWVGTGAAGTLRAALLREGERSVALRTTRQGYSVPVGDDGWSDEAIVELVFAGEVESARPIRTAGETPRTAP